MNRKKCLKIDNHRKPFRNVKCRMCVGILCHLIEIETEISRIYLIFQTEASFICQVIQL